MANSVIWNLIFSSMVIIVSCKGGYMVKGNCKTIDLIIEDYQHRNKKDIIKHDVFYIYAEMKQDYGLSIYYVFPQKDAFLLTSQNNMANIPTHYVKYKGKTFLWREGDDETPSRDIMDYLNAVNLIDSVFLKLELGMIDPETATLPTITYRHDLAATYIFCFNKTCKIKKRIRTIYTLEDKVLKKIKCR